MANWAVIQQNQKCNKIVKAEQKSPAKPVFKKLVVDPTWTPEELNAAQIAYAGKIRQMTAKWHAAHDMQQQAELKRRADLQVCQNAVKAHQANRAKITNVFKSIEKLARDESIPAFPAQLSSSMDAYEKTVTPIVRVKKAMSDNAKNTIFA